MILIGIFGCSETVAKLIKSCCPQNAEAIILSPDTIPDDSNTAFDILVIASPFTETVNKIKTTILISSLNTPPANIECSSLITCGFSGKDTITPSSISGEKCCISIQREIISVSGKIIEPQEIEVTPDQNSVIDIMLIFAALMAMDIDIPKNSGSIKAYFMNISSNDGQNIDEAKTLPV